MPMTDTIKTGIFRPDIRIIRRDPVMLFDPQADAYYRISARAARIISRMTSVMSMDDFLTELEKNGISATAGEVSKLLAFLRQNNLLVPEYSELSFKRGKLSEAREKSRFLRWAAAYMYFRLPPMHPEKFFRAAAPYLSPLASKKFIFLLMIPAVAGYILALQDLTGIRQNFADTLSWAGMAKYFAAIVFLKIIHEAAHSLAAIRFNCRVRGIGIGFMLFYPRLYTDTTDSWQLPRRQRLLIDGAGIIAELLTGGIAALLYFYLPPGVWRSTMFYIFTVSTISTLLVNGNPFIRYDGYYILCDLTGIDNLMSRSGEHIRRCWRYYLLQLGTGPQENHRWFLLFFGIGALIYRIFLYTAIILVIYHNFIKAAAWLLLAAEIWMIFLHPVIREIREVRTLAAASGRKAGIYLITLLSLTAAAVLFIPWDWSFTLAGEVVPAHRYPVTVVEAGYLTADLPEIPVRVTKGEKLLTLSSPQLSMAQEKLQNLLRHDELQHRMEQVDEKNFASGKISAGKIAADRNALQELQRRQQELTLTAPADGIFRVFPADSFRKGRFLARGTAIGEVADEKSVICAYADEKDAGRLRAGDPAEIYVSGEVSGYPARVTAIDQVASPLDDSPLLQIYGGEIPVGRNDRKTGQSTSARLFYRVELKWMTGNIPSPGRRISCRITRREQLFRPLWRNLLGIFRREF